MYTIQEALSTSTRLCNHHSCISKTIHFPIQNSLAKYHFNLSYSYPDEFSEYWNIQVKESYLTLPSCLMGFSEHVCKLTHARPWPKPPPPAPRISTWDWLQIPYATKNDLKFLIPLASSSQGLRSQAYTTIAWFYLVLTTRLKTLCTLGKRCSKGAYPQPANCCGHYIDVLQCVHPFSSCWTLGVLSSLGDREYTARIHLRGSNSLGSVPRELTGQMTVLFNVRKCQKFPTAAAPLPPLPAVSEGLHFSTVSATPPISSWEFRHLSVCEE